MPQYTFIITPYTCFKFLVLCTDAPSLQNDPHDVALGDNVYEQIDLKPNYEEVEVSTNTAYGMVRVWDR